MSREFEPILLEASCDGADFLIIDVETTGLSADTGDRICELGMVKLHGGEIEEVFGMLIDPQREISPGAYAVNKISPKMLLDAPSFTKVAHEVYRLTKGKILVAYNAPFDLGFLKNELRMAGVPPLRNHVVDALALARQLLPGLARYSQEQVARVTGLAQAVSHRALDDAKTTAMLFHLFLTILKAHGCSTLKDLWRKDLPAVLHGRRLDLIQHALRVKCNLWIKYLSPADNYVTDGVITPVTIINESHSAAGRGTVVAVHHTTGEQINLRVVNILDLRLIHPFPR